LAEHLGLACSYLDLSLFTSKEMAYGFVTSEEYAPLMELRVNQLTDGTHAVLIPGEITTM
jgi:hypothetical protein|tara:strand:- start:618 stop:797 length:180 start_codon:yes stop_codon:yes gene_type:complete